MLLQCMTYDCATKLFVDDADGFLKVVEEFVHFLRCGPAGKLRAGPNSSSINRWKKRELDASPRD